MTKFKKYKKHLKLFLKYKKNKHIRKRINFEQRSRTLFVSPYFDPHHSEYYIKNDKLNNYVKYNTNIGKKKYIINSYLYNILSKLPRKYTLHFLGKQILRKYTTKPLRISMIRFFSSRVFKNYYLANNSIWNLSKNQPHIHYPTKNSKNLLKKKITLLESRLDNSLLRLLNFKSIYNIRQEWISNKNNNWRCYKTYTKQPFSIYNTKQVRQLIKHGHVFINKKKVTSFNYHLNFKDTLSLKTDLTHIQSVFKTSDNNKLNITKFKVKNYTQLFYLIYRNWYLEPNLHNKTDTANIQLIIERIGFDQSIFHLWPVLNLIKIKKSKNPNKNIIQFYENTDQKNLNDKNYGEATYKTHKCLWVRSQQGRQRIFYNQIYNQIQFNELELDFFQSIHQYYNRTPF